MVENERRDGSPSRPQIELRGVSKRFGATEVVTHVDLAIPQGEFFSLLGPSGCGKSTILKMIAGFDEPTEGDITVAGRRMAGIPPEKRNIGFVFQNYALFPHMSVADNVAFGLLARGIKQAEAQSRVTEMLDLVELAPLAHRRPAQLSGGQQQRVALARALAIRPDVLLLDEPFGALDRRLRQAMQEKVVQLQKQLGVTTIFVTHDQEEALTMSDRVAVMSVERHGFEQIGSPRDIYEKPSSARVSTFIGQTNLWNEAVASVTSDGDVQTKRGFRFRNDAALQPGATVILSLRPERIVLLAAGDEPKSGATVLSGRVRDTIFVGDVISVLFDADIGVSLRVKQLNSDRSVFVQSGDTARVTWMPDALRVLQA